MIEHLLSHLIGRKIERRVNDWVAKGRARDAIPLDNGDCWSLRFGFRDRLQLIVACIVFGFACLLALFLDLMVQPLGFWLRVAYGGFIFPVFLLSAYMAVRVCSTQIKLSDSGIVVRRFGMDSAPVLWSEIDSVYHSPATSCVTFVTRRGRRLRISTQINGLQTLAAFVARLDPAIVDRSFVNWLNAER